MKIGVVGSSLFRQDGRYTGTHDVGVTCRTAVRRYALLYVLNPFSSANIFKKMTWWKRNFIISVFLLWKIRVKNGFF